MTAAAVAREEMSDIRIVLIHRRKKKDAFSIEEIFHSVADELRHHAQVVEYEVGGRLSLAADIRQLRAMHADIYHVTGDVHYLVPLLPRRNTVLTIHDLGHYRFGVRGLKRVAYKLIWLSLPIRTARVVTAVSRETRDQIIAQLEAKPHRVVTIENCYSPIFKPAPKIFKQNRPTILQVGVKAYKNVPRLIEALKGIDCRLVLIGQLDEELRDRLEESGLAYEAMSELSHEAVYDQYVRCDVVAFASLGEGFGVPIIEAQATGRPVVTSDASPMREIAGAGACLVDPRSVDSIRAGLKRVIEDAAYRSRLVQLGFRNAEQYSSSSIAIRYLALYRDIADSSRFG